MLQTHAAGPRRGGAGPGRGIIINYYLLLLLLYHMSFYYSTFHYIIVYVIVSPIWGTANIILSMLAPLLSGQVLLLVINCH